MKGRTKLALNPELPQSGVAAPPGQTNLNRFPAEFSLCSRSLCERVTSGQSALLNSEKTKSKKEIKHQGLKDPSGMVLKAFQGTPSSQPLLWFGGECGQV